MLRSVESLKERILSRTEINPISGCREWRGCVNSAGYGQISSEGKVQLVHRLMYQIFVGEIPEGLFVCHTCDNRKCCNPEHLWLGTSKDNIRDAAQKGRVVNRYTGITHCKRGHEFTMENTYFWPNGKGRKCKTCACLKQNSARQAKRVVVL